MTVDCLCLGGQGSLQVELGDFRRTLPEALTKFEANKVVVVACHACSHLSDEVLQMCSHAHVDFAVGNMARSIGLQRFAAPFSPSLFLTIRFLGCCANVEWEQGGGKLGSRTVRMVLQLPSRRQADTRRAFLFVVRRKRFSLCDEFGTI